MRGRGGQGGSAAAGGRFYRGWRGGNGEKPPVDCSFHFRICFLYAYQLTTSNFINFQEQTPETKRRRRAGPYGSDVVGVQKPPPSSGPRCYKECAALGLTRGPEGFLDDADVKTGRFRLIKVDEYKKHLVSQRNAEDDTGKMNLYQVRFLTNRQKRLVAYYKIFRHIYTKGKYREVLPLPSCVCFLIRKWWPDDDDDRRLRGDVGDAAGGAADSDVEEEEGNDDEEEGE